MSTAKPVPISGEARGTREREAPMLLGVWMGRPRRLGVSSGGTPIEMATSRDPFDAFGMMRGQTLLWKRGDERVTQTTDSAAKGAERLPDKWEDERGTGLSEPELLLYRSNLLGSDLRITNYGGGNTSAKVARTTPSPAATVGRPLGQGLGRRPRLHEAGRLRDPLPRQAGGAEAPLPRPRARGRDGRLLSPLHLRPEPARRLDRHAAARLLPARHVDHMHPDAMIAIAASRERRAADAGDLRRRDRLAALAAAGLRPRPEARGARGGATRTRRASCSAATASSPGATRSKRLLPDHAADHPAGRRLARRRRAVPAVRPAPWRSRSAPRPSAGAPRPTGARAARQARRPACARSCTSPTRPRCSSSWTRARAEELAALGTSCPDHFLRTKIRPLFVPFEPAQDGRRRRARPRSTRLLARLPRTLRGLLRALQAARLPGDARPLPGARARSPASACSPSRRTRRRRGSRPSST